MTTSASDHRAHYCARQRRIKFSLFMLALHYPPENPSWVFDRDIARGRITDNQPGAHA